MKNKCTCFESGSFKDSGHLLICEFHKKYEFIKHQELMKQKKSNLNILVPKDTKIAVVGDIHEHEYQFDRLLEIIKPSEKMYFVSVGDIYDKGYGPSVAHSIIGKIREMCDKGYGFIVCGNHELKHIKKARSSKNMTPDLLWFEKQPLALSFLFDNGSRVTVLHGGVKPSHTWDDLDYDIETSYIRKLDDAGEMIKLEWVDGELQPSKPGGISWHEVYDGRFGYIVAGHEPLKDGKSKFYNYSCNTDTSVYTTGILTAQILSETGIESTVSVSSPI